MGSVVYSPLCDTDRAAYIAYLAAVIDDGRRAQFDLSWNGGVGCHTGGRRCVGDGADVVVSGVGVVSAVEGEVADVHASRSVAGDDIVVSIDAGVGEQCGSSEAPGLGGGYVGHHESRMDNNACDKQHDVGGHGTNESTTGDVDRTKSDVKKGKNWERNRIWREQKKRAKRNRRQRAEDASKFSGYFSTASGDVQQQLVDTRARLYIARNQEAAIASERRVQRMNSKIDVVGEALRVARLEKKMNDLQGGRVSGWARTVFSQASEEFVNSAVSQHSSLPSMESLAFGESLSEGGVTNMRKIAYESAMANLRREADAMDSYVASDYLHAEEAIKAEYEDVAYTEGERFFRRVEGKIVEFLSRRGYGQELIEDLCNEIGI